MSSPQDTKKRQHEDQVHPFFQMTSKKLKPNHDMEEVEAAQVPENSVPLRDLLDFSSLSSAPEITARFDTVAKALLHDYILRVDNKDGSKHEFEVMELEFYLQKQGCHEDPFTHGSEEQKISGRWYFHRAPRRSDNSNRSLTSLTAYRDGSRKGLDLTIGAPVVTGTSVFFSSSSSGSPALPIEESKSVKGDYLLRGGILLRSLRLLGPKSKVISGPSLLVDQILSSSGASSISDLVESIWGGDTSAFSTSAASVASDTNTTSQTSLHIVPRAQASSSKSRIISPVYSSPRIGLDLSHPGTTGPNVKPLHSRIRFLPRRYRFFVCPHELVANGRSHTFLAALLSSSSAYPDLETALKSPNQIRVKNEICRITGLKEATVLKYLEYHKAGRDGGASVLQSFIGANGKGASSSPASYLKIIGAISTLSLAELSID